MTYVTRCLACSGKGDDSKYYGESSRTAYERGCEHNKDYQDESEESHMHKHQVLDHPGEDEQPEFEMRIVRQHKSAFERQVHEAVLIEMGSGNILNSRGEFNRCEIPRLRVEVGERIVAFDKGKGEKEMTGEEDALQLLARKRIKEDECPNAQSSKRRRTKPAKPARRVACKRERTKTETVAETKSTKRMRKTTEMTGPTGESLGKEAEMPEVDVHSEMTRELSTKVRAIEFSSNKSENKPKIRTIIQFFDKISKGGAENSNEKPKKNSQFKLKTQFGKLPRKSTYRSKSKSSSTQHQAVNSGLAAPNKNNLVKSAKFKPITAYFSPLNKEDNEKSCDAQRINS